MEDSTTDVLPFFSFPCFGYQIPRIVRNVLEAIGGILIVMLKHEADKISSHHKDSRWIAQLAGLSHRWPILNSVLGEGNPR